MCLPAWSGETWLINGTITLLAILYAAAYFYSKRLKHLRKKLYRERCDFYANMVGYTDQFNLRQCADKEIIAIFDAITCESWDECTDTLLKQSIVDEWNKIVDGYEAKNAGKVNS